MEFEKYGGRNLEGVPEDEMSIRERACWSLLQELRMKSMVSDELQHAFVSDRSIVVGNAISAIEKLLIEIDRLREYEWKYNDLCD